MSDLSHPELLLEAKRALERMDAGEIIPRGEILELVLDLRRVGCHDTTMKVLTAADAQRRARSKEKQRARSPRKI